MKFALNSSPLFEKKVIMTGKREEREADYDIDGIRNRGMIRSGNGGREQRI